MTTKKQRREQVAERNSRAQAALSAENLQALNDANHRRQQRKFELERELKLRQARAAKKLADEQAAENRKRSNAERMKAVGGGR